MNPQQEKIKQREPLENAYDNFVQPHINQLIEVNAQSLPTIPVTPSCFYCASGWLLLTLLYCVWMRWRKESHLEPKTKNNIRY